MPSIKIYNQRKEEVGEIDLADEVFAAEVKPHLLHQAVRKQRAAKRAGTHAVKRRSDVSGGGRKPFRQKGTGRARQGTIRAPHMRGGGVVFGPEPRSYDFKVNKKEMAAALRSALSIRAGEGAITVLDALELEAAKTKGFKQVLADLELDDALFVADASDNVVLSSRNLQEVSLLPPQGLNVYDVLNRKQLVLTKDAVEAVTARLGTGGAA
jgi:large subunit ribosomal protein L4